MQPVIPFAQQNITLPERVAGILTTPQSVIPVPGVLLLHGSTSQKDEVGVFYHMLAASSSAHPKKALILTRVDHLFGILGEDKSVARTVIELVTRWLVETLSFTSGRE